MDFFTGGVTPGLIVRGGPLSYFAGVSSSDV